MEFPRLAQKPTLNFKETTARKCIIIKQIMCTNYEKEEHNV